MSESDYKHWLERNSGWLLVGLFCLIPTVILINLNPLSTYGSWAGFFANLGKITGIIGLVLYAINLLLSTRLRFLENLFGGLNRVYIAHHITGGIALALLLFHPLFLAIRYLELHALATLQVVAKQLLPRGMDFSGDFPTLLDNVAFNSGIIAFIGMVGLLFVTFFVKLPYRFWLFTHRFLGLAFMFAGIHSLYISSDIKRTPVLFWYMFIWITVGIVSFVYRSLLSNIFVRRSPYKVERVQVFAGNTVAVEMTPIEKGINFKPGQFVFIRFIWSNKDGIIKEAHPFSIASAPGEDSLRLYMKALGDYTHSLKNLKAGTIAEIEGAFGKFSYTNYGDSPQIWIAGGIGVTPFLSMARSLNPNSPPVDMFYSVLKREELVDQKALAEFLPEHYGQFKYHPYIGAEQTGFLNAKYVNENVAGGIAGKEIFICGPPPMMKSLRKQLREMGVPNNKIHSEEFAMS